MNKLKLGSYMFGLVIAAVLPVLAAEDASFTGDWALYPPGGGAGWLGVESANGGLKADMLWIGGSVLPFETAKLVDGKLILECAKEVNGPVVNGKASKVKVTETVTVEHDGAGLKCVGLTPKADGKGEDKIEFKGKPLPELPPTPDLSKVKFGKPVELFNGQNLDGWKLTDAKASNGWGVKDGILFNDPAQEDGKPHKRFGNLRTEAEFEDFGLHVEVRVGKEQNSGVYLRGIYEVQVYDTFGKGLDPHNMGAIYSRITPLLSAEKPAGEWQTLDIVMVDRHVTVKLNDKLIIDNQPLRGPTGGALWPEVDRPGPIYLQGDHTGIEYRKLSLKPVVGR